MNGGLGKLSLGIDLSTQSISATVIDFENRRIELTASVDYLEDERLARFGIGQNYILGETHPGDARQPAAMFLAAIDAVFSDLSPALLAQGLRVSDIGAVNISAQQHGHVYLSPNAPASFAELRLAGAGCRGSLVELLSNTLMLPFAKIWRTSDTGEEAAFVRNRLGKTRLIELSGSDAPLRFSAFSVRKTAKDDPSGYASTRLIHQLNSFAAAALTGNANVPLDFGNACGVSLMDYIGKKWSSELLSALADGLPGGAEALASKLPALASGKTLAGRIARYFVEKYGFDERCVIGVGSGDNPQAKVLVAGTLLSLGTSFVVMAETDGKTFEPSGNANAMYDALDRPFMFGCRTNGALCWDDVRGMHGFKKRDFGPAEAALNATPPGNDGRLFLWQAEEESFPKSGKFGPVRIGYQGADFAADYTGIVESALAAVYLFSRHFTVGGDVIHVTGGGAKSPSVLKRIAAIWERTVIPIGQGGASLGAAVSAAYSLLTLSRSDLDAGKFAASFVETFPAVKPDREDMRLYHAGGGMLEKFLMAYNTQTGIAPVESRSA